MLLYFFFILSLVIFMFYFVNTFYYVSCLLILIVSFLINLVLLNSVSSIFSIMLALIYIGAIIIFIGYVCAISPNPLFISFIHLSSLFSFSVCLSILGSFLLSSFSSNSFYFLSDFFYRFDGIYVFFTVIFILFFILLTVSSQYFLPKGPFRAVS